MFQKLIEQKIADKYGFEVPTIVKTPSELEHVLQNNPFLKEKDKDPERMYVTFLATLPAAELVESLKGIDHSPEEYVLDGKNIYLFSPLGSAKAKMSNNYFEGKLKVVATSRNWKTVNKLVEMARLS